MTSELQATLKEALTFILDAAKSATAFSQAQIPLLIQEKLRFDFWNAIGRMIFLSVLLASSLVVLQKGYKRYEESSYKDGLLFIGCCLTIVSGTFFILSILLDGGDILQITIAPRLYILEWAKELIK